MQVSIIRVERVVKGIGVVPIHVSFQQSAIVRGRTECHIDGACSLLAELHEDNGRDGSDALEKGDDQHAEEYCEDSDLESPLLLGDLVPQVVYDDAKGCCTAFSVFSLLDLSYRLLL